MLMTDDNDNLVSIATGVSSDEPFVINDPNKMPSFDELLKGLEWIDAKVRPPEPGLIVKRWKWPDGTYSYWAGYCSGGPKLASCDSWLALPK